MVARKAYTHQMLATHCHNQLMALLYNKQEKKKKVTIKQKKE